MIKSEVEEEEEEEEEERQVNKMSNYSLQILGYVQCHLMYHLCQQPTGCLQHSWHY
tara:strand:- start:1457 stop:1624 length:168 start_codon:yes stop_codon:yes gene_type:complete